MYNGVVLVAPSVNVPVSRRAASRARRRAAVAARDRFGALLAKTRITSPIDVVVIARFADPGETLGVAAPPVTVADLTRVRVEAEVDEIDFAGLALGAEAIVSAEGFPGQTWRGRVGEIPGVVVGRALRLEDTRRPVDTRVLLVKIAPLEPTPLKLGQRVGVRIGPVTSLTTGSRDSRTPWLRDENRAVGLFHAQPPPRAPSACGRSGRGVPSAGPRIS